MKGKIVTVVVIAAIAAALFFCWAWLYFFVGGEIGGGGGIAMRAIASMVFGGALIFLGIALFQRITEIKRGDEDDLGDY